MDEQLEMLAPLNIELNEFVISREIDLLLLLALGIWIDAFVIIIDGCNRGGSGADAEEQEEEVEISDICFCCILDAVW